MKDLAKLGKIIRAEREKENKLILEVSALTGIHHTFLQDIEAGKVPPNPFTIYLLKLVLPGLVDHKELYELAGIIVPR